MRKRMWNEFNGQDEIVETEELKELTREEMMSIMDLSRDEFDAWDANRQGISWEMILEKEGLNYYFDEDDMEYITYIDKVEE